MARQLRVWLETWPLKQLFSISRGTSSSVTVAVVEIRDGDHVGRGESVPYKRYGETPETVIAAIAACEAAIAAGLSRAELQTCMRAGSARNALDCALWDLDAKRRGQPVWVLASLPEPSPASTFDTLAIAEPDFMAAAAAWPSLKIKLDNQRIEERVRAVRDAAPDARLIVDANESWTLDILQQVAPALADLGVLLIEQPLPAGADEALRNYRGPLRLAADESCHVTTDLPRLRGLYDVVSLKLNKTGGLTEALAMIEAARGLGFDLMMSCMNATSLAVAPAVLLASRVDFVDLDGAKWLARDRPHGLVYADGLVGVPDPALWG